MLALKNTWLYDMIGLVYPQLCCACKERLTKQEELICYHCLFQLPKTNFHLDVENPMVKYLAGLVPFEHATALYYFLKEGRVQELIHQLKYEERYEIGVKLGTQLGRQLKGVAHWQTLAGIVPVPLHPKKIRKRGYNQSDAIGEGVAKAMDLPLWSHALIRNTHSETQTKKSRTERWENVESIFTVTDVDLLTNTHVLVVDDVMTTGSTLLACAEQLLEVEGLKVSFGTLAWAGKF